MTYSFAAGGDAGGRFQINTSTGVISVSALGASTIDYETSGVGHSYDVTVQATDGTLLSTTQTFTIAVSNVAPTQPVDNDGGAGGSILEGSATGTVVGVTGFSTDPANTTITYSLTDDAGGRFQINGSSGIVSVGPGGNLIDFETQPVGGYSITIQASDGQGGLSTQSFLVAVANAAPGNFTDTNGGVADIVTEGVGSGQATGLTVNATDPAGTTVTYSLTNDAGGRFQINTSTGEVLTGPNANLIDFELSLGSYTITVQASDGAGGLGTTDFVIAVADAAPGNWSDLNAAANLVTEGDASNTLASLQANAIDPNGGTVSYSFADLAASAGGRFKIDAATGIISIDNAGLVDFEFSGGAYAVTVTADDGRRHAHLDEWLHHRRGGPRAAAACRHRRRDQRRHRRRACRGHGRDRGGLARRQRRECRLHADQFGRRPVRDRLGDRRRDRHGGGRDRDRLRVRAAAAT